MEMEATMKMEAKETKEILFLASHRIIALRPSSLETPLHPSLKKGNREIRIMSRWGL